MVTIRKAAGFKEPRFKLKITQFAITLRGPHLSNKMLDNDTKIIAFFSLSSRNYKRIFLKKVRIEIVLFNSE